MTAEGFDDEPRLRTGLRVQALLRQAESRSGVAGGVLRRGDPDSGALLVRLRLADGRLTVLSETRTATGRLGFARAGGDAPLDPDAAAALVDRAVGRDPDLWVIEFDSPDGLPPFVAIMV